MAACCLICFGDNSASFWGIIGPHGSGRFMKGAAINNFFKTMLGFIGNYRTYVMSMIAGEIGAYIGNVGLEEIMFRSTGSNMRAALASIAGEEIGYMAGFLVPVARKKKWGIKNYRQILGYAWKFEKANAVACLLYFPIRAYATYQMTKHGFEPGLSAILPQLVCALLIYYPLMTFCGRKAGVVQTEAEFSAAAQNSRP